MEYRLEKLNEEHREPAIDILNYYVEDSFAAYSESKLPYSLFDVYLEASAGYPAVAVRSDAGEVVGFAWLQAFHPSPAFHGTAEVGYFLRHDHTRRGIGKMILDRFTEEAREIGIGSILASTSSLNERSIKFHLKNGFSACGRFEKIGRKFGRDFDLVWFQKRI